MQQPEAFLLQRLAHLVTDGLYLAAGLPAADNKEVGEGADQPQVKQQDILRLLLAGCLYRQLGYRYPFLNLCNPPRLYYIMGLREQSADLEGFFEVLEERS